MSVADVSPAPVHIGDALKLADLLRPSWPVMQRELRESGVPLNDGEEDEEDEVQPSPDDEHSPDGNQPGGEEEEVSADFLDTYDLGDVPEEARPVAEAAVKRLQSAYTKQRQQDTQAVREAQQAQLIVDGLADPLRAPAILQALGVNPTGEFDEEEDDEFFADPNDRVDALEAQLAQRDQIAQAEERARAENTQVTQQIEKLEDDLQTEFTDDEIGLLYMYADEYRDAGGNPDVAAAHKVLDAIASTAQQRLIKAKGRAPRRMGKGAVADRQVDLNNPEKRRAAMERAAESARASLE